MYESTTSSSLELPSDDFTLLVVDETDLFDQPSAEDLDGPTDQALGTTDLQERIEKPANYVVDLALLAGPSDEELAAIEGLADFLAERALAVIGEQLITVELSHSGGAGTVYVDGRSDGVDGAVV